MSPLLNFPALALALLAVTPLPGQSRGDEHYVASSESAGSFPLVAGGRAAAIHVSAQDYPGVIRAANDLRLDVGRVTRIEPVIRIDGAPGGRAVLVGTLGKSPLIDRLV